MDGRQLGLQGSHASAAGCVCDQRGQFRRAWHGAREVKKTKKRTREVVVVLDDVDEEDDEEDEKKFKIPTNLVLALAAAFTHNSSNPNVAALTSASGPAPTEASGSMRLLVKETHTGALSHSPRVEVVVDETDSRLPRVRRTGMAITRVSRCVGRENTICTRRPVHAENDGAFPGMAVPQTSANKTTTLTMRSRSLSTRRANYAHTDVQAALRA